MKREQPDKKAIPTKAVTCEKSIVELLAVVLVTELFTTHQLQLHRAGFEPWETGGVQSIGCMNHAYCSSRSMCLSMLELNVSY